MFKSKTLFVVGAGASKEAGLPLGQDLKKKIANVLDFEDYGFQGYKANDPLAHEALKFHNQENDNGKDLLGLHMKASKRICKAMSSAPSIDNFVNSNVGDKAVEFMSKLGIAKSILDAESGCHLKLMKDNQPDSIDFDNLENKAWYPELFKILNADLPKGEISSIFNNVSFISFNYDRCIEHYLYGAILNYYGPAIETLNEVMKSLKVIHPYGQVGFLPWQENQDTISFGENESSRKLLSAASQIKTFSEQVADEQKLLQISSLLQDAEIIIFIGFAFFEQNMKLLKYKNSREYKRVYATALGISDSNRDQIKSKLSKHFNRIQGNLNFDNNSIEIRNDLKSKGLFEEFSRVIVS